MPVQIADHFAGAVVEDLVRASGDPDFGAGSPLWCRLQAVFGTYSATWEKSMTM
ncbi:hypothetical protein [Nonomuraea polychroma]|uniref:hypothetical protein n=1 Tax=Nonomuraea polychroma TaxID=46176 RepID=UPI0013E2A659|nr:hypothetical protein [Nonomuraea polychroma]